MSQSAPVDPSRVAAQAAGLARERRAATIDMVTRIAVALIVVGGLAVAVAAGSHDDRAIAATGLTSVGVALAWALVVVARYRGVRRRLRDNPAAEVARWRAKPRRRPRSFATAPLGWYARPLGALSEDRNPNAGDPYAEMRNLEGLGPDASPDGVNRSTDPNRGPIE